MSSSINGGSPVRRAYDDIRASTEGEKEEGVVDVQSEPLPPIFHLPPEVLVLIFNYAAGSDQPGDAKTLCLIRRVCRAFNRLSDDVLRMYWIQLGNGREPVFHFLVTSIERRPEDRDLSYFSRFQELTRDFGRMGVRIPKKDRETAIQPPLGLQPLQYVQELQKVIDASLKAIWPHIRERVDFGQDPVPDDAAAIRQWLNDPANAGRIAQFTELNFVGLHLRLLPPEIGKFTQLQKLYLGGNQLEHLPLEIGNLTRLETLTLNDNQLTTLPPQIGKLTQLQSFDLAQNQLTILPPEIGNLIQLKSFLLGYNRLISLPSEISKLSQAALFLEGNPLLSILCVENPEAWRDYETCETEARENVARHIACSSYSCQSSLATLCQAILCGVDGEGLQEYFEKLSSQTQELIRHKWASPSSSSSSSSGLEDDLFANSSLFAKAVMSALSEKFNGLFQEKKTAVYRFSGRLIEDSPWGPWGKPRAEKNIIRLIDVMEFVAK